MNHDQNGQDRLGVAEPDRTRRHPRPAEHESVDALITVELQQDRVAGKIAGELPPGPPWPGRRRDGHALRFRCSERSAWVSACSRAATLSSPCRKISSWSESRSATNSA